VTAVLLVAADDGRRERLRRALSGLSVFVASSDAEAMGLLRYVDVDVVVRDATSPGRPADEFVAEVRRAAPAVLTATVGSEVPESDADFTLPGEFTQRDVESMLARLTDKQRLMRELAVLRARVGTPSPAVPPSSDPAWDGAALARALKEFTRVFATGFDLGRAREMFLDAIAELVRPSRMALLMPDGPDGPLRIATQRGLAPAIVSSVHLTPTGGLAHWLRLQGRPARLPDLDPEAARELVLIHCVVAVPLLAHGELVGVLALGHPVVRVGYGAHEIETLFDLATHLATMIRDVGLHHQLAREKEFSERILAHMSNGVITIDRDHRIGTFNRRAEEILSMPAPEVRGRDLRLLPSPLGDMLYETLATGHSVSRSEIQIALGGRWLEVSTYPVRGEEPAPLGAVLVFEDLTAQKELLAQKREAEQFQLLTRVVARIADEIKNPLVSINTFVELIEERFDDPAFRKDFASVVGRDARRLVQVFEKLVGLVSEGELHFTTVDVHVVVDDVVAAIGAAEETAGRPVQIEVARDAAPQRVKTDVRQLEKALSYLVWYLTHNSPGDPARVTISIGRATDTDGTDRVRILVGSRTATVPAATLQWLFDPVHMVQESVIDVGPAVSQRVVEAMGGHLRLRQGRHELAFLVTLPAIA
jgi:two-component system, NtrC family, sensor histidine kinase AtoS